MRLLRNIVDTSNLSLLDTINNLIWYLEDTYGLDADVINSPEGFKVFFNHYTLDKQFDEDKLANDIKRVWNKTAYGLYKATEVYQNDNFYCIRTEDVVNRAETKDKTQSQDLFLTEATYTLPELKNNKANEVLDNKFIWLFTVVDHDSNIIDEDIPELNEAIDILVRHSAAMLVAVPYVDPDPENDDVELVLVENPGPVIVYDASETDEGVAQ